MFYGKANDEKHYQKIAQHLMDVSPKYRAQVAWADVSADGKRHRVLEIRVFQNYESVGYRFWVSPFDGQWEDTWVYQPAMPQQDGDWGYCLTPDRIGEPGNWGSYGGRRPFAYTNFAKTTATYFFEPNGPLTL
jgi:hypothetical protein